MNLPNGRPISELTDTELINQSFAISKRIEDYKEKLNDPRWNIKAKRGIRATLSGNIVNPELLSLQQAISTEIQKRNLG